MAYRFRSLAIANYFQKADGVAAPTHDDWKRLGAAVRDRRDDLGFAQGERAPSSATWRKVEKGIEPPYAERTVRAICRALDWPKDAFDRLLAGEDPTAFVERPDTAPSLDHDAVVRQLAEMDAETYEQVIAEATNIRSAGRPRPEPNE